MALDVSGAWTPPTSCVARAGDDDFLFEFDRAGRLGESGGRHNTTAVEQSKISFFTVNPNELDDLLNLVAGPLGSE